MFCSILFNPVATGYACRLTAPVCEGMLPKLAGLPRLAEPMIVGQTIPYSRIQDDFTSAEREGAIVAHHEIARASLTTESISGVDFFLTSRLVDQGAMAALRSEFPNKDIAVHRLPEVMQLCRTHKYVFPVALESLPLLAAARLNPGCGLFPISGIVHSISSHASALFYIGLSVLGEAYDRVVVTSEAGRLAINVILEQFSELIARNTDRRAKIRIPVVKIPFGVDEAFLCPRGQSSARERAGLPQNRPILLYLGRITEEYKADLEPLLIAIRQIRDRHDDVLLVIAGCDGDGEYTASLKQTAATLELQNHISFKTNFPRALKPFLYSSADIFVSPVDNIQETFGLAVLEAAACGIPVVASDWSGYRDLVLHGTTGFLVPTYWDSDFAAELSQTAVLRNQVKVTHELAQRTIVEIDSLVYYLESLLSNPDLRRQMGALGRERVLNEFRWVHILSRYIEMWETQWDEIRCQPLQRMCMSLGLNDIYRHFASTELSKDLILEPGRARQALCNNGDHVPESSPLEPGPIFARPKPPQELEGSESSYKPGTIAWLWKKGYLQRSLQQPAGSAVRSQPL